MPLLPEPIFYQTIKREDGAKRKLIFITNSESETTSLDVTDVEKPEWIEIEELYPGSKVEFPGNNKRTSVIVNLNTNHRFFPHGSSMDEAVKVQFSDDSMIEIPVTIHQIQEGIEDFRGVFAIDFGTTNTCYAYKGKIDEFQDALSAQKSHTSDEIPTLVFFKDVSSSTNPKYMVGNSAKQEIQEFGWQTYSYFQSIKRELGRDAQKVVMDEHVAEGEAHRKLWHVEEIAGFIARDIIKRAQDDIDQRILKVVATYPTLFTMHQKEALTRVFHRVFSDLGVEVQEDTVALDLDETNAAAFNYIYGTMIQEMKGIAIREKRATLLSYDFGGGTIDVSLIGIRIVRDDVGRITIHTDVKGLTGERFYGGDNVTLEVMKILKLKAAKVVANNIMEGILAERKAAEDASKKSEDDVMGFFGGGAKEEDDDDMFGSMDDSEDDSQDAAPVEEEDPELSEITREDTEDEYNTAAEMVHKHLEVIERCYTEGIDITTAFMAWEEDQGTLVSKDQSKRKAQQLGRAVERLVPTMFDVYRNENPRKEEVARRLFFEFWQESDILKIRLSNSQIGTERVASEFKRIAKYSGVDKIKFTEIEITTEELEAAVTPRIRGSIEKAFNLFKSTKVHSISGAGEGGEGEAIEMDGIEISGLSMGDDDDSGISLGGASGGSSEDDGDDGELRILLAGNGARLPIIKRLVKEVFQVADNAIIMDKGQMKTGVARGAAEEHYLRRAFGKAGIIKYEPSGFLDKIPYTVGLYNPDLEFVGFKKGFCPLFPRETKIGTRTILSSRNNPLIFEGMTILHIYTDYHDESTYALQGFFDFTKPVEGEEEPPPPPPPAEEGGEDDGITMDTGVDGGETASAGGEEAEEEGHFRIEITLLPSRQPQAKDMQTGKRYNLIPQKDVWKAEENPFSGVH